MIEAKVNTRDFPLDKPAALYTLWLMQRLGEQGIEFAPSDKGPFSIPTGKEAMARMVPPWDVWEDFDGILHVRQGARGHDAASRTQT